MIELSIIIPHYDSISELKRLIHTIPHNNNIQIIVVDDHSNLSDGDVNDVRKMLGDRGQIRLEAIKRNAGACRNIGIELATGKWILFSDADDYFTEDFYETVSCCFQSEADIVFFPHKSITSSGDEGTRHLRYEKMVREYIKTPDKKREMDLRFRWDSPCSKMIRKSMIEKEHLRFEEIMYGNDALFSVKCGYYAEKIDVNENSIYVITESTGSLTGIQTEETYLMRSKVNARKYAFLREKLTDNEMNYFYGGPRYINARFYLNARYLYGERAANEVKNCFQEAGFQLVVAAVVKLWIKDHIIAVLNCQTVKVITQRKVGRKLFRKD